MTPLFLFIVFSVALFSYFASTVPRWTSRDYWKREAANDFGAFVVVVAVLSICFFLGYAHARGWAIKFVESSPIESRK
jgi:protein-S-isoprenylcysteine O-methyltransferase Ste14